MLTFQTFQYYMRQVINCSTLRIGTIINDPRFLNSLLSRNSVSLSFFLVRLIFPKKQDFDVEYKSNVQVIKCNSLQFASRFDYFKSIGLVTEEQRREDLNLNDIVIDSLNKFLSQSAGDVFTFMGLNTDKIRELANQLDVADIESKLIEGLSHIPFQWFKGCFVEPQTTIERYVQQTQQIVQEMFVEALRFTHSKFNTLPFKSKKKGYEVISRECQDAEYKISKKRPAPCLLDHDSPRTRQAKQLNYLKLDDQHFELMTIRRLGRLENETKERFDKLDYQIHTVSAMLTRLLDAQQQPTSLNNELSQENPPAIPNPSSALIEPLEQVDQTPRASSLPNSDDDIDIAVVADLIEKMPAFQDESISMTQHYQARASGSKSHKQAPLLQHQKPRLAPLSIRQDLNPQQTRNKPVTNAQRTCNKPVREDLDEVVNSYSQLFDSIFKKSRDTNQQQK